MADHEHPGGRPDHSWFGERIQSDAGPIEAPESERDVIRILSDPARFPSPIRPVGSRHSMTPCMSAEAPSGAGSPRRWGTLVETTRLVRLRDRTGAPGEHSLRVIPDPGGRRMGTVTVPAGRTFISVARELDAMSPPWAFRVNTELGPLTIGAAACGATKDSSFPNEPGQVCHDVVGMRLIKPDGEAVDLREGDPDLEALRCSYGLFGIVTEVTFRVYPREYISLWHEELEPESDRFTIAELTTHLRHWLERNGNGNAVFLYLFPYTDRILAELVGRADRPGLFASAVVIANVCLVLATMVLIALVRLDLDGDDARRAAWYLLVFPTSLFLSAGYSESLFLLLTMGAIRNVQPVYLKAARSMHLSRMQTVLTVLLPATLPEVVAGLRIGFTLTLLGVLLAEMFAAKEGLGYLIVNAMQLVQNEEMITVAVVLFAFAAVANALLLWIERRFFHRA